MFLLKFITSNNQQRFNSSMWNSLTQTQIFVLFTDNFSEEWMCRAHTQIQEISSLKFLKKQPFSLNLSHKKDAIIAELCQ